MVLKVRSSKSRCQQVHALSNDLGESPPWPLLSTLESPSVLLPSWPCRGTTPIIWPSSPVCLIIIILPCVSVSVSKSLLRRKPIIGSQPTWQPHFTLMTSVKTIFSKVHTLKYWRLRLQHIFCEGMGHGGYHWTKNRMSPWQDSPTFQMAILVSLGLSLTPLSSTYLQHPRSSCEMPRTHTWAHWACPFPGHLVAAQPVQLSIFIIWPDSSFSVCLID